MAIESFDVNWSDVELVNQPTGMTCWAASAAMVVGWRDHIRIDEYEAAASFPDVNIQMLRTNGR